MPPYAPHPPYAAEPAGCPIIGSSDWAAWVNAMPGPSSSPRLIATGKVTVPTGGYRMSFDPNLILRRSYPAQAVATLRVIPPAGAATQAVVTQEVRGSWASSEAIGSFEIRCGDQLLARISPVETAH